MVNTGTGTYPIWAFAGKDGRMHIGAGSCKDYDDREKIFGTQIPHRCVVYDRKHKKHRLVTPTEALSDRKRYAPTDLSYISQYSKQLRALQERL